MKGLFYWRCEEMVVKASPFLRNIGRNMFKAGMESQGASAHSDRIVPSLRCVPTSAGTYPKLLDVSSPKHIHITSLIGRLDCA